MSNPDVTCVEATRTAALRAFELSRQRALALQWWKSRLEHRWQASHSKRKMLTQRRAGHDEGHDAPALAPEQMVAEPLAVTTVCSAKASQDTSCCDWWDVRGPQGYCEV